MQSTLVERYRPRTWDEVYGNEWIKTVLKRWIKNDCPQHMIFAGRPGCGKTTIGRVFASEYFGLYLDFSADHPDYRELNASDERGIDVIRGRKVKKYCQTRSSIPGKKRILYLIEAGNLTIDAQRALRAIMENNQDKVIIIMDMNHLENIKEDALLSRSAVFEFDPQPLEYLAGYFKKIANAEGIKFTNDSIVNDIVNFKVYEGDFRRVINDTLQKLVGINRPVTKKDIPWIYKESYQELIDRILNAAEHANSAFFSEYRKRYINPIIFIRQLFMGFPQDQLSFELCKIFAEVEYRLKSGADELIQLSYLLTAIEGGV